MPRKTNTVRKEKSMSRILDEAFVVKNLRKLEKATSKDFDVSIFEIAANRIEALEAQLEAARHYENHCDAIDFNRVHAINQNNESAIYEI